MMRKEKGSTLTRDEAEKMTEEIRVLGLYQRIAEAFSKYLPDHPETIDTVIGIMMGSKEGQAWLSAHNL